MRRFRPACRRRPEPYLPRPSRNSHMAVHRIVANIATPDPGKGHAFYEGLLGLKIVMDHGWIVTFADDGQAAPQVSFASEGGSGTPVPDLSIEVDNLDEVHARMLE